MQFKLFTAKPSTFSKMVLTRSAAASKKPRSPVKKAKVSKPKAKGKVENKSAKSKPNKAKAKSGKANSKGKKSNNVKIAKAKKQSSPKKSPKQVTTKKEQVKKAGSKSKQASKPSKPKSKSKSKKQSGKTKAVNSGSPRKSSRRQETSATTKSSQEAQKTRAVAQKVKAVEKEDNRRDTLRLTDFPTPDKNPRRQAQIHKPLLELLSEEESEEEFAINRKSFFKPTVPAVQSPKKSPAKGLNVVISPMKKAASPKKVILQEEEPVQSKEYMARRVVFPFLSTLRRQGLNSPSKSSRNKKSPRHVSGIAKYHFSPPS